MNIGYFYCHLFTHSQAYVLLSSISKHSVLLSSISKHSVLLFVSVFLYSYWTSLVSSADLEILLTLYGSKSFVSRSQDPLLHSCVSYALTWAKKCSRLAWQRRLLRIHDGITWNLLFGNCTFFLRQYFFNRKSNCFVVFSFVPFFLLGSLMTADGVACCFPLFWLIRMFLEGYQ